MRFIISILLTFSMYGFAQAGTLVRGCVTDAEGKPLSGAAVRWKSMAGEEFTDGNGCFAIENPRDERVLVVSFDGYATSETVVGEGESEVVVTLDAAVRLDVIEVSAGGVGTTRSRASVANTEQLNVRELRRAACCSLAESFETNPSVDVSFSDAVTGARQIQLLGLAGTYVQSLTENYPNFRGAASVYGLDYIPGSWMESIQISKGAASVKNGYESITGQMNVEYKQPDTADPLSLNAYADSYGRLEGNADAAVEINENLSTGLLLHYSTDTESHDKNKDGFMDMPRKDQFNVMNRWMYVRGRYAARAGVRYVRDYRESGQISHGGTAVADPYRINVNANRLEFFTKNAYTLDYDTNENLALIFTGSYHDQKSTYDVQRYNVYQTNLYASLIYEREFSPMHALSAGVSMNYDKYTETLDLNFPVTGSPGHETTTGIYAQYTLTVDDKFTAMAGLRADYSTLHKTFFTPRLHLKYMPARWVNLRFSAGMGYRTVFVMPENSFYLASSRRIEIADDLKQERAWNVGGSVNFYIPAGFKDIELSAEWYHTRFSNQVVADLDSDPHAVMFYNLDGRSYSNSVQFQVSYPLFRGFNILGAYRLTDVKSTYGGDKMRKPLTSRYKALITANYETRLRKWQFDFTVQFNGGGRMPRPDAVNPLWRETFGAYTVMNAQVTKNFRNFSVYAGGENLTDKRQKDLVIDPHDPRGNDFDATMVWGPVMGRKFYVGVRFNINK